MQRNHADKDDLPNAARAGDRAAGEALLQTQRPWLTAYVKRKTRTAQDAEDMIQEVLQRAFASLPQFQQQGAFSTWVLSIADNLLKNYYTRTLRKDRQAIPLSTLEENGADVKRDEPPVCPYDSVEAKLLVQQLLIAAEKAGCSQPEREVLQLVYQEVSYEEIGVLMETAPERARQHFLRGRLKLLVYLVQHEPDLLGGQDAVAQAWHNACGATRVEDRPTQQEQTAWAIPAGRVKEYRNAVMKLARFLPLPAALLAFLWGVDR